MSLVSASFTSATAGSAITIDAGATFAYAVTGTFVGTWVIEKASGGGSAYTTIATGTGTGTGFIRNDAFELTKYRFRCTAYTSGTMGTMLRDSMPDIVTNVGTLNQPASGSISINGFRDGPFFQLTFTLNACQLPVTDAAGSGSSASLKIFDFIEGGVVPLGCRQDYTAFAEGAALTGAAGDAAFVMGLGSAAANAGDAALTGTEVDFGAVTGTITLSGGTGTGTKFSGAGLNTSAALDGTTTAVDLYLNWSGSAATIDANSTIDVTGSITVVGVFLGDD